MADTEPQAAAAGTRRDVIKLLRELDPNSRPTFHGHPVDREGLTDLARAAVAGDARARTTLAELYELRVIADLSGDPELADAEAQWHENMELLPHLADGVVGAGVLGTDGTARELTGHVLLALLDPDVHGEFAERANSAHPVLAADRALGEMLSRIRTEGGEPVRLIAAALISEDAQKQFDQEEADRRATEEAEADERRASEEAEERQRVAEERTAAEKRARPVRRRDRAIVGVAVVLVATVWPAAALGDVLSRVRPFRDAGAMLLRRLNLALPVLSFANWATGAAVILAVAALMLCIRRQIRPHRLAMTAIPVFAVTAGALVLLLPGIRNSAWGRELSQVGTTHASGSCARSQSATYVLRTGIRQPVNVGPPPACQLVTRFAHQRGRVVWERWIRKIHIRRIHKFDTALVVGGTYGGSRAPSGVVKGGRLVAIGLGPLTGRELWRRTCRSPREGDRAIAFLDARGHRPFVRLRCGGGRILRVNPRNGRSF